MAGEGVQQRLPKAQSGCGSPGSRTLGNLGRFGYSRGTVRGKLGVPGVAPIILGVLWESQEPAPADLSYLFERNNFHLLSGAPELFPGEPVCCTPLMNEGCRHGSVRQNV